MAKFQNVANEGYIVAMRGLRSSNAAQPHTLKKNKGTRSARSKKAMAEY